MFWPGKGGFNLASDLRALARYQGAGGRRRPCPRGAGGAPRVTKGGAARRARGGPVRTLWSGGWCPPAGWGRRSRPTRRWWCCPSCPPPCRTSPRARPSSWWLALRGEARLRGGTAPPAPPPAVTRVGGPGVGRAGRHLPISSTIKMTFKFFSPGFMSFIRKYVSLAALMLRPARGWGLAGRAEPASRRGAEAARGRAGGHRRPSQGTGTRAPRGCAVTVRHARPPPLPLHTDTTSTAPTPSPSPAGTEEHTCAALHFIPAGRHQLGRREGGIATNGTVRGTRSAGTGQRAGASRHHALIGQRCRRHLLLLGALPLLGPGCGVGCSPSACPVSPLSLCLPSAPLHPLSHRLTSLRVTAPRRPGSGWCGTAECGSGSLPSAPF